MSRRLKWGPPARFHSVPFTSAKYLSCWDCENIQVAGFPSRRCRVYPKRFIVSPISMSLYVKNYGKDACGIYNECKKFRTREELDGAVMLVWDEVDA